MVRMAAIMKPAATPSLSLLENSSWSLRFAIVCLLKRDVAGYIAIDQKMQFEPQSRQDLFRGIPVFSI